MKLLPRGRRRGLIQKGFFCLVLDTSIFIALSLWNIIYNICALGACFGFWLGCLPLMWLAKTCQSHIALMGQMFLQQWITLCNILIQDLVTGRGKSFWPGTCPWPDQNSRKGQDQARFTCWVRIWESGSQNAGYFAFAASIGSLHDLITWSAFGKHENSSLLKNQSRQHGFVWKTMQAWLDGKIFFSHASASNFRRPLQSLVLRYTAENSQVTYF